MTMDLYTMQISPDSRSACANKIALVVGGSKDVFEEYALALALCRDCGLATENFVMNDMIVLFPDVIDHALTLHPDKLSHWIPARSKNGFPPITETWGHRDFKHVTDHTRDWGGSSGLFAVKIARELGFVKIVLCGVPMTVEATHIKRGEPWNAAHGFRRAWMKQRHTIKAHIRSMSGWTAEQFGVPTEEWLQSVVPDTQPMQPQPAELKA